MKKVVLQKALADAGVASRRRAEELIVSGNVSVNSAVVTKLGTRVDPEHDAVSVRGRRLNRPERKVYFLLHKPRGAL